MTTITAKIPSNLKDKVEKFIEEIGGEIIVGSNLAKKRSVLKELEEAFAEAREIKDGKMQGVSLDEILSGE